MSDPDSSCVSESRLCESTPAAGSNPRLDAEVVRDGGDWSAFEPVEAAVAAAVAAVAACDDLDIGWSSAAIALASDERVRELNRAYRGKDKPTNVLSFPAAAAVTDGEALFLGDIVLAVETIAR